MKKIRNYQPNILHVLDDQNKTKQTFYSLYSFSKWLICSGYSRCDNTSKGIVSLAGAIRSIFIQRKSDIVNAYGLKLKLDGKVQPGLVVDDTITLKQKPAPIIMLHSNGHEEYFNTHFDFGKKYGDIYHLYLANVDTGVMKKRGNMKFALYSDDNRSIHFPTYDKACAFLHMNETRLRGYVKKGIKVRGKIVTIGKK